jgi:hypothetical protein
MDKKVVEDLLDYVAELRAKEPSLTVKEALPIAAQVQNSAYLKKEAEAEEKPPKK